MSFQRSLVYSKRTSFLSFGLACLWLSWQQSLLADPLGNAFTYQGRLQQAGVAVQGTYEIAFSLYNAAQGGTLVAGPLTNSLSVSAGQFTAVLDFGARFTGQALWLELAVRTNGAASFITLAPRQALTPAPYASYAASSTAATTFSGSLSGEVSGTQGSTVISSVGGYPAGAVASGASAANAASAANVPGTLVKRDGTGSFAAGTLTATAFAGNGAGLTGLTASSLAPGQVVKSLNGLTDAVTLVAGSNVSLRAAGNTVSVSAYSPALPAGTLALSPTADNSALAAAGFGPAWSADPVWQAASPNAAWSPRTSAGVAVLNGSAWLVGGYTAAGRTNDVWCSTDGATWAQAAMTEPWTPRTGHMMASFNNRLWLLGGADAWGRNNDVWVSDDGTNYNRVTTAAPWSPRAVGATAVFLNRLWLLGGGDAVSATNDVWSTADGTNWTLVTSSAPWAGRLQHRALVCNNQLWLMGGSSTVSLTNDVWVTPDGLNWTCVTNAAAWSPRYGFGAAVLGGRLLVFGGSPGLLNDVWYSTDGASWTQVLTPSPWSPRQYAFSFQLPEGRLWLAGGQTPSGMVNDLWYTSATPATLGQYYLFQKY